MSVCVLCTMLNFSRPSARSYTFKAILIFLYGSLVKKLVVLAILQFDYGFVMSWGHNNNTQNEMELELRSMAHLYVIVMTTEHNHLIGEFDRRLISVELLHY